MDAGIQTQDQLTPKLVASQGMLPLQFTRSIWKAISHHDAKWLKLFLPFDLIIPLLEIFFFFFLPLHVVCGDLSAPTRDPTRALCSGSTES